VLHIHIGAAGRLRERYWLAACQEYRKRLTRFCKLSEREGPDDKDPEIPAGFFAVALCSRGEPLSSEDLARKLAGWQNNGLSRIAFLIGGSDGLSRALEDRAGFRLSLSRMTWPHHMARAMLLEQIYRAFSILEGGKYHK